MPGMARDSTTENDQFHGSVPDLISPATHAFEINPSDEDELDIRTRAIYVGTAGDLTVTFVDDDTGELGKVTFANLPVGLWPFRVKQVWSSGTDASDLVGVY